MRVFLFTVLFFTLFCQMALAVAPGAPAHIHDMFAAKEAAAAKVKALTTSAAQSASGLSSVASSVQDLHARAVRRQLLKQQAIKREQTRRAANLTVGTNKRFALRRRSNSIARVLSQ
ncbi:hypothetical protein CF319_g942 [Tilletia indica]|uniref:Uncharacterized protein n=1 Tax=Tilletia indica TaxID=43049 RepID=A0A177TQ35_9BASI|nr:hypothetical protein CF319_g942 [Tilletia indica]KAE8253869.1 hypothetical protein A4X13_0g3628 [Tilletia indica]